MKIRNGYVSNSSSSSFVVIGYLINDKTQLRYWQMIETLNPDIAKKYQNVNNFIDNEGYEFTHNHISIIAGNYDNGFQDGKTIIGKFLGKCDDCGILENKICDISEIEEELKDFQKNLLEEEKGIKVIISTMLT